MDFSCTTRKAGEHLAITVAGDIDLAVFPQLDVEARAWLGEETDLVLDCSGVTFMDSMGLRVLVNLRRELTEAGHDLLLGDPSEPVTRVLELAGVRDVFQQRTTDTAR